MRTSRWLVPGLAAVLALVLAGSVLAWLQLRPGAAAAAPTPQLIPVVLASPASTAPTPTPTPFAPPPGCRPPEPVQTCLGPPPGPQLDAQPERVAAPQDRYALLIGITRYGAGVQNTVAGAADAQLFRDLLLAAGWRPENIRLVTDREVTGRAIRLGLAWLAARSQPGTFTLFHYSGHVKQLGGPVNALWPVDADWVRPADVVRLLQPAQGRLWVDIAGCEAGSFVPGLAGGRVLVSASSRDVEKSYENPEWGLSVWTSLLLDQGVRQRQADADGDGRVTLGEALRWASHQAQVVTWGQVPYGPQTPQVAGDPVRGWTLADPPA